MWWQGEGICGIIVDYGGLSWFTLKFMIFQILGNPEKGVLLSKGRILDIPNMYIPFHGPLNRTRDKPVPGIYIIYVKICIYIYIYINIYIYIYTLIENKVVISGFGG